MAKQFLPLNFSVSNAIINKVLQLISFFFPGIFAIKSSFGRDFSFFLSFLPVALLDTAGNLKVDGCLRSVLLKKGNRRSKLARRGEW
jgi:hypothetical protein